LDVPPPSANAAAGIIINAAVKAVSSFLLILPFSFIFLTLIISL